MMEMVERVARAIAGKRYGHTDDTWPHIPPAIKADLCGEASAAIEAMREPTDEMTMAFIFTMKAGDFESAHNAMIDVALSRNQKER